MCTTCGCSDGGEVTLSEVMGQGEHDHDGHGHEHTHDHAGDHGHHAHSPGHEDAHAHRHTHDHAPVYAHEHHHGHDHGAAEAHRHDHGEVASNGRGDDGSLHGSGTGQHDHPHPPARPLPAQVLHKQPGPELVALEAKLLAKNDRLAERNRGWLRARDIVALNLVSSPGSGKTTLLARTLRDLAGKIDLSVIEGDQATANDARRIQDAGGRAIQINTGSGCHLEADMVAHALEELDPRRGSFVIVENVGNLVCPALFDLGEQSKVVILSVTEGTDKPLKYPHMFGAAEVLILNKIDLAPYVDFDVEACIGHARRINPDIQVLTVSATRGDGLDGWYRWLLAQRPGIRAASVGD